MKRIALLIFVIACTLQSSIAQNSTSDGSVLVLLNQKKTEVKTTDAGELHVSVTKQDFEKFKTSGFVDYESFGAKGDGKVDDIDAIAAAHAFANETNLPVKANNKATYYIGGKNRKAVIRTNTDFGKASFIINDTDLEKITESIFLVNSMNKPETVSGISSLKKNQSKIEAKFSGPQLISVINSNVKHYIRFGLNQNNGSPQIDVFIVDKDGNVDMNAPIIWDFDEITSIVAFPIDEQTLTLKGGKFQTIANQHVKQYKYHGRGIDIKRSNVLIDGLEHTITGEGESGAPYRGFISIDQCANVTVQNTNLTGHKVYSTIGSAGSPVLMGTYDIHANRALNISIINCKQLNDITDSNYWGIFASNFCKNILFDNCTFSRFDAHQGVTNATIRNSKLGHQGINAIGVGTLIIENSTIYARSLVSLRSDYGSTWNGEFIIRNCVFVPRGQNLSNISLISGSNSSQHNFGYTCYMPERITIENLQIKDADVTEKYNGPAIFSNFNPKMTDASYVEKFPYIKTKEVILKNISTESGKKITTCDNDFIFKDVVVTLK